MPGLQAHSPLDLLLRYGMGRETLWVLQNKALLRPFPARDWLTILFNSFWGHFGWMSIPFVRGSTWVAWLLGWIGLAVAGFGRWALAGRGKRPPQQARLLLGLMALVAWALGLLVLNSLVVAHNEQIKQGRYLFPLLVPIGLLLAFGQQALVGRRWRPLWLGIWLSGGLIFAGAALARIGLSYGVW